MNFRDIVWKESENICEWAENVNSDETVETVKPDHYFNHVEDNGTFYKFYAVIDPKTNTVYITVEDENEVKFVDGVGMSLEKINDPEDVYEAIKDEFEMFVAHYDRMLDELEF